MTLASEPSASPLAKTEQSCYSPARMRGKSALVENTALAYVDHIIGLGIVGAGNSAQVVAYESLGNDAVHAANRIYSSASKMVQYMVTRPD